MKKQAMIMAAGLGTRMRPWTEITPKALLVYRNKTLLEHVIAHLMEHDFLDIVINIHHLGEQIIDYLEKNDYFHANITISDERDLLLDTGGGLMKAAPLFGKDPFLVHNVDIMTDLNLTHLLNAHLEKSPLATLAVKERETTRPLLTDQDFLLRGWRNNLTGEERILSHRNRLFPIAFSGIYVLDPHLFTLTDKIGPFPIIPELLNIARTHDIRLYPDKGSMWKDMGKPESFREEDRK